MIRTALTVSEMLGMIDSGSSTRSAECTPMLQAFNIDNGSLQFNTHCASSRNTWAQRVQFRNWYYILDQYVMTDEDILEKFSHLILAQNDEYGLVPRTDIEEVRDEDIMQYYVDETEEGRELSVRDIGDITFDEIKKEFPEVVHLDINVSCNCPAFLYWGSAYIMDLYDSGEQTLPRYTNPAIPEQRYPVIRDPQLEKGLCKHLIAVMTKYFR